MIFLYLEREFLEVSKYSLRFRIDDVSEDFCCFIIDDVLIFFMLFLTFLETV